VSRVTVVAVDFDGTITRRDTVVPFMMRVAGRVPFALGIARRLPRLAIAVARRDRNAVRAIGTAAVFTGRDEREVTLAGLAWGRWIVTDLLRADVVGRIGWHREQGHRVVIVSASYEQYLHTVASHLAIDGVVGTRLAVGGDGRLTGALDGANCRGPEKVARLDGWLATQGLARDEITLWAYGDSPGDRELLAAADHPVWVTAPLASVAPTP
jgi:phosphatidylglycerophosphatase C